MSENLPAGGLPITERPRLFVFPRSPAKHLYPKTVWEQRQSMHPNGRGIYLCIKRMPTGLPWYMMAATYSIGPDGRMEIHQQGGTDYEVFRLARASADAAWLALTAQERARRAHEVGRAR